MMHYIIIFLPNILMILYLFKHILLSLLLLFYDILDLNLINVNWFERFNPKILFNIVKSIQHTKMFKSSKNKINN